MLCYFLLIFQLIRTILEKIVVRHLANFEKQICIQKRMVENLIQIVARAAQFTSEPSDASSLCGQYLFNAVPNGILRVRYSLAYRLEFKFTP